MLDDGLSCQGASYAGWALVPGRVPCRAHRVPCSAAATEHPDRIEIGEGACTPQERSAVRQSRRMGMAERAAAPLRHPSSPLHPTHAFGPCGHAPTGDVVRE